MLAYPNIFVHVDASTRSMTRVALAARIASAQQCRMVGVCATYTPQPWFYRMHHAAECVQEDRDRRQREHERMRQRFESAIWERSVTAEWRMLEGEPVANMLKEVREAGLLVMGQTDENDNDSFVAPQFLESMMLEAGRPLLVVPYAGEFHSIGTRVLLAWDGGRECARALHDALPLLAGSRVHLLHANSAMRSLRVDATPAAHAVRLLRDVGAEVETEYVPAANDLAIGEMILSRAADTGADLIVMGAYGHSRFREITLGGVTRTILSSMTVPVLLGH
ncbi:universal stress protein [Cupriavidus sp. Marseille-Q8015]|nr:MAG: universal stress protein [Cupriavidus sp.]